MLDLVAKELFLTKGKGVHEDRLTSFEYALRDAGIAGTNLVLISSIFPPQAKLISRKEGLKKIKPGQILFTIYSKNQTKEPHRVCSASVGIAQPKDTERYGYLSEYESFGQNEVQAGDYAEDIAAQMLASSLGIPFDADKDWDEKDNNGPFLVKFTILIIPLNLPKVTKMENGPLFLQLQCF